MFGAWTMGGFCFLTRRNARPCEQPLGHVEQMGGSQTSHVLFIHLICFVSFGNYFYAGMILSRLFIAFLASESSNGAVEHDFTQGKLGYLFWICTLIAQYLFLFLQNIEVVTGRHTLLSTDWMGGIFDLGKWRWCCYGN